MAKIRRGRLSNADRQRIHDMYSGGKSIAQISKEVERREDIIAGILGLSKKALAMTTRAAPVGAPKKETREAPRAAREEEVLEHRLWVRPGYQIVLRLPADLSAIEAERLSVMVKTLPFS